MFKFNIYNLIFFNLYISEKVVKPKYRLLEQIKLPFKKRYVKTGNSMYAKRNSLHGSQVTMPLEIDGIFLKPVLKRKSKYDENVDEESENDERSNDGDDKNNNNSSSNINNNNDNDSAENDEDPISEDDNPDFIMVDLSDSDEEVDGAGRCSFFTKSSL